MNGITIFCSNSFKPKIKLCRKSAEKIITTQNAETKVNIILVLVLKKNSINSSNRFIFVGFGYENQRQSRAFITKPTLFNVHL